MAKITGEEQKPVVNALLEALKNLLGNGPVPDKAFINLSLPQADEFRYRREYRKAQEAARAAIDKFDCFVRDNEKASAE